MNRFLEVWQQSIRNSKSKSSFRPQFSGVPSEQIRQVEEFLSAVNYVNAAPKQKSKLPKGRQSAFEKDVSSRAKRARTLGRSLLSQHLDLLRHFRASGMLDQQFATWKKAVAENGEASILDIWKGVLEMEGVKDALSSRGITPANLSLIGNTLAKHDQTYSVDTAGKLRCRVKQTGQELTFADVRIPKVDRNLGDLLGKDRFDTIASRLDVPGRVTADVITRHSTQSKQKKAPEGEMSPEIDLCDGNLVSSLVCMRELNRQVLELEESGIPDHEGELAGWLIAMIALLAAALALALTAVVLYEVCLDRGDDSYCTAAAVLLVLAALAAAAAFFIVGDVAIVFGEVALGIISYGAGIASLWVDTFILAGTTGPGVLDDD